MSILSKLFGGVFSPKSSEVSLVKQTKKAAATVEVGQIYTKMAKVPLMHIDLRSLERNKYAPWGRGVNSRLPVIKCDIPAGNR